MTTAENEQQPRQTEAIRNKGVTIEIIDPGRWAEVLESQEYYPVLDFANEDLPTICRRANVTMYLDDGEHKTFHGSVDFTLLDNDQGYPNWQDDLLDYISDTVREGSGMIMSQMPNSRQTRYAQLDADFEVEICIVEEKEHFSIIASTSHAPMDTDGKQERKPTPQFTLLKNYLQVFSSVISGIKLISGETTPTALSLYAPTHAYITKPETQAPDDANDEPTLELPRDIVFEAPRKTMHDLGGLTGPKAELSKIINALQYPELASFYGLQPNHFLLHGPSGTGKHSLVEAFVAELGAELRTINTADVIDKWVGSSGKNIQAIFDEAKEAKGRIVLFFDGLDALASKNEESSSEREDVKSIIKQQLAIVTKSYPNVFIAATTNSDPDNFDEAIVGPGRLKPIYVAKPTEAERIDTWHILLLQHQDRTGGLRPEIYAKEDIPEDIPLLYVRDIDPFLFAKMTDGLTGQDIQDIIQFAHFNAFSQAVVAKRTVPITNADMLFAIKNFRKS